jgi:hypothetical protein
MTPCYLTVMTPDPYPNERYRCRDDEEVVVGSDGLREHGREHVQRGDGPPEWDVLGEDDE